MQDDVVDFNINLSIKGDTLVAEASSPLGECYGTSAWPRNDELEFDAQALGKRLFPRLLPGAVQNLYHRCRGRLTTSSGHLRLRVQTAARATARQLVRIHSLPWELVHDPHGDDFLALDPQVQLIRYLNIPTEVPEALQIGARELEVLVVIACPSDQAGLRWDDERAVIERAFAGSAVRVTVLPRATRAGLLEMLGTQRHDVLHFIGHGEGPTCVRPGRIALESEDGCADWITAQELALIARVTTSLRLVFLNACSTAELAETSYQNLAVGPSLALRGVPAVVAMTSAVRDSHAVAFARSIYTRLRDGATLEAAVHAARIAVRLDELSGDIRRKSWTIPVVFSRMPASQASNHRAPVQRSQYEVRMKGHEVRGTAVEIAGRFRDPAAPVHPATEDVLVDVDVDNVIGETVTIGGVIDSDRRRSK